MGIIMCFARFGSNLCHGNTVSVISRFCHGFVNIVTHDMFVLEEL